MEHSVVNFSDIVSDFRLDAEAYKHQYLEAEAKVNAHQTTTLGKEVKLFVKGIFDIRADVYAESGIPFVRIANLRNMGINEEQLTYIPVEENNKYLKTFLSYGDIILSKTAYPAASLVTIEHCNASQDTIAVKLKKDSILNNRFLVVFLNCLYGNLQMERWFTGNIQMHLNLTDSKNILIPVFSSSFQNIVGDLFDLSGTIKGDSKKLYQQAERQLLEELGLNNWLPPQALSFVRTYSNAEEAERWDADYHHPKYTSMIEYLSAMPHETLDKVASFSNGATPLGANYPTNGIPFLRIQNIGDNQLILDDVVYIDQSIHTSQLKRSQLKPGDVLITITGRIGTSAVVPSELSEANINQHIVRLRIKSEDFKPYYLAAFLNTLAGRLQTERESYGTTREALPYYCLKRIIVPKISVNVQEEITEKILDAQNRFNTSYALLDIAKRTVEIAVEQNEINANTWLNDELRKLGIKLPK